MGGNPPPEGPRRPRCQSPPRESRTGRCRRRRRRSPTRRQRVPALRARVHNRPRPARRSAAAIARNSSDRRSPCPCTEALATPSPDRCASSTRAKPHRSFRQSPVYHCAIGAAVVEDPGDDHRPRGTAEPADAFDRRGDQREEHEILAEPDQCRYGPDRIAGPGDRQRADERVNHRRDEQRPQISAIPASEQDPLQHEATATLTPPAGSASKRRSRSGNSRRKPAR